MAVAFDAASESHTGTTGSTSEASFSWTHTPSGTPAGVLVFTFMNNSSGSTTDIVSGVTYGGVAMSAVSGGRAVDNSGEPGDCKAWFLGSSVPSGNQTVQVTRTNNAFIIYAVAFTVTAGADTEVYTSGIVLLQNNQTLSEQSVTDGSPGSNSLRFAGCHSGLSSLPAAGANSTAGPFIDLGIRGFTTTYETTAGQGSRSIGFSDATSDDVAAVHLAVREVPSAGEEIELSAGSYAITGQDATLTKGWALSLDAGIYTITGQDVSLLRTYILTADAGSLAITGQDASLLHGYLLNAEAGAYALTGQDISLLKGWMIELDSDWPVITGQDAELTKGWLLTTEAGSYVITGQDVTLAQAEAYVKRLAVASMTSRRGSASVSTNRASGSAGVNQGSAAITTTTKIEYLLEDGSGFIELENGTGYLLLESSGAKPLTASVNNRQGTSTIN